MHLLRNTHGMNDVIPSYEGPKENLTQFKNHMDFRLLVQWSILLTQQEHCTNEALGDSIILQVYLFMTSSCPPQSSRQQVKVQQLLNKCILFCNLWLPVVNIKCTWYFLNFKSQRLNGKKFKKSLLCFFFFNLLLQAQCLIQVNHMQYFNI